MKTTPFKNRLINWIISLALVYGGIIFFTDAGISYSRWGHNAQVIMQLSFWILTFYHLFDLANVVDKMKKKTAKK